MAHEITEKDNMFSVREKPWHGLGDVLENAPSVDDARKNYLTWKATGQPLFTGITDPATNQMTYLPVQGKKGIVRDDTNEVIGVVGARYQVYQNSDMWDFIEAFSKKTNFVLETAGSLRRGETTWVLAKGEQFEVVPNDPISMYFLFRNAYNGLIPISTLFTNIRVVCNNTLTAALKGAQCMYNVRHVGDIVAQMKEVEKALSVQAGYQEKVVDALTVLKNKVLTADKMKALLENDIFPITQIVQDISPAATGAPAKVLSMPELSDRAKKAHEKRVGSVLKLVETGAGADIPGVQGTAYGLYQAIIEWNDHDRTIRPGKARSAAEARFEAALLTGVDFKTQALEVLLKAA